jgi:hypothetical protein
MIRSHCLYSNVQIADTRRVFAKWRDTNVRYGSKAVIPPRSSCSTMLFAARAGAHTAITFAKASA